MEAVMNRKLSTLAVPISAFLFLWLVPWLQLGPWTENILEHNFFRIGPGANTVSSASYFLRALAVGFLAIVLTEPYKWFKRTTAGQASLAAMFQACLLIDAVRVNSLDWFAYCLHYFGIAELRVDYGVRPALAIALPFPWISLVLLIALALFTLRTEGEHARAEASDATKPTMRLGLVAAAATASSLAIGSAMFAMLNFWSSQAHPDGVHGRRASLLLAAVLVLIWAAFRFAMKSRRLERKG
jgi:hypothetical protein